MRESLFEKLKKKEISYIRELNRIKNLLNESITGAYLYFSQSFKNSPISVYYEDLDEAMLDIIEVDTVVYFYNRNSLSAVINNIIEHSAELTLDSFLDFLELFRTLSEYQSKYFNTNANQIKMIVQNDCEKIGYAFVKEDNNTFRVMLKHPEAEAVALSVKESTRDKIYRYLMIRYGRVEEKRECIKSLADDVEVSCKKYSGIAEYDKLKQFIQCVRHTKDNPKKEFPFYYENEEKWLDMTFEMIIGILAFTKTKDIVKEIKKLESN